MSIQCNKPSEGEMEYIREGLRQSIRGDGRKNEELREMIIEKGILKQANGSSLVRYSQDNTIVYTGIKAQISNTTNDQGIISLKLESAQRRERSREEENRVDSDKETLAYLETVLQNVLVENISKQSLCIVPNSKAWLLSVDVFLLQNIQLSQIQLITAGIAAALQDLILPKVTITHNQLTNEDDVTVIQEQFQTFSLSDFKPPKILLIGQIGRTLIHDMDTQEYYSVDSKYLVVIDPYNRRVLSIKKTGAGFVPPEDFAKIAQFALQSVALSY